MRASDSPLPDLKALQHGLDYTFKNVRLLKQALTHRSFANEAGCGHNERLEFLGDAVLDLIISEVLMSRFPDEPEGTLSKMKATVVNRNTLLQIAQRIDLGRFLILGKGEERTLGRNKLSLLSNGMEAVIGAIYQDGGLPAARMAVLKLFSEVLEALLQETPVDYKSALQEFCQQRLSALPVYRVVRELGPDHRKGFEVSIQIGAQIYATGMGVSKKSAEQSAAQTAFLRVTQEG
jgi:ribonuclease III